jgi:hypothetical protein
MTCPAEIGGIPEFSKCGRPDSRSGGGAGGGVSGEVATINGPFCGKIDFTPSARPAEGRSSASRWPLSGPALAVSRAFACRVSRRRLSAESPARDPCNANSGRSARLSSLRGEFSANWRAGRPKRACEQPEPPGDHQPRRDRDHRPPVNAARSTSPPRYCREGPSGRPTLAHARRAAPAFLGSRAPWPRTPRRAARQRPVAGAGDGR